MVIKKKKKKKKKKCDQDLVFVEVEKKKSIYVGLTLFGFEKSSEIKFLHFFLKKK